MNDIPRCRVLSGAAMHDKPSTSRLGTGLAVVLLSVFLFVGMAVLAIYVEFFLTPKEQSDFLTADAWWLLLGIALLENVLVWITLVDVFRKHRRLGKTFRSAIPVMACEIMFNIGATTFYWSRELWKRPTA
jgi:hypothetical protein